MHAVLFLILSILDIMWWIIVIGFVMSWLVAFNVINLNNQFVYSIYNSINTITEPIYRPLRSILPDLNGIDFSPMIVLLGLMFLRTFIQHDLAPMLLG